MPRGKDIPYSQRASLTLNEAMRYAGVGHRKAKKYIKDGDWRAYENGKEIRVIRTTIDAWMDRESELYHKAI